MKVPNKVEYLVVGGGLVGLSVFKKLQTKGKDSILIESSGELGGSLMREGEENFFSLESLIWTQEKNLDLFKYDTEFLETLCSGKKGLIPFIGFGDKKISTIDLIDIFTSKKTYIVTGIKKNSFSTQNVKNIFLHSQITALFKTSKDSNYNLLELNGKTRIQVEHVIWTAPVQELNDILPEKDFFNDFRKKIKKSKDFDVITAKFKIAKEKLGDFQNNKFIFMGEEQAPWMGCALSNSEMTFISFYDSVLSSDHDFIRKHLKLLKRHIQKTLPNPFTKEISKKTKEKISLHRSAMSSFNPAIKKGRLKILANFYLLSSCKFFRPHSIEKKLKAASSSELYI